MILHDYLKVQTRPSQLDSTATAFIHLESWGKVENANELSEKLQSLRKIDSHDMGYFEKGHDFVILCFHWRYGDRVHSGLCVDLSSTPRTEGKRVIKCVSQA